MAMTSPSEGGNAALNRWRGKYPGTTLGQLHELDPELVEEVLRESYGAALLAVEQSDEQTALDVFGDGNAA